MNGRRVVGVAMLLAVLWGVGAALGFLPAPIEQDAFYVFGFGAADRLTLRGLLRAGEGLLVVVGGAVMLEAIVAWWRSGRG